MNKFWLGLTQREQILIVACGVTVLCFLLYVLVINPILSNKQSAYAALEAQKQSYSKILSLAVQAERVDRHNANSISRQLPIREAATEASRTVGVAISRIQPGSDDKVTFWIDNANTQEMNSWLLLLKDQYGWQVSKVSLNKNSDGETLRGQFEFGGSAL